MIFWQYDLNSNIRLTQASVREAHVQATEIISIP